MLAYKKKRKKNCYVMEEKDKKLKRWASQLKIRALLCLFRKSYHHNYKKKLVSFKKALITNNVLVNESRCSDICFITGARSMITSTKLFALHCDVESFHTSVIER